MALGAYGLYAQSTAVFVVLGVAWVGASVGRLISVAVDRSYALKNCGGVVFEFTIGVLLLVP